ncbi:TPA: hypothetical protein IVZ61_002943, partial [Enterococcus faecium]|nr:hypothetical protein [Enterococcus faecium]
MRILSIFFTNDRKCIIASMLSKTGNYRLYYSLYPFEKKDMICERSFMIVPIGIKKGKLIYKEKNQVNHFYVPNCKASGFLNNVRSIDYNTLLHDTYKNLSLTVTNDKGGNIVFVNQEKLNIPVHFTV